MGHSDLLPVTSDVRIYVPLSQDACESSRQTHTTKARAREQHRTRYSLCNRQQVVPVHTLILANLVVHADPTGIDHDASLLVGLGVEEVVTFRAEVE